MATFNNPRKTAATVTAPATLARGFHTPVDATSGPITMTLPTGTPAGVEISVEKVDTSANAVVVSGTMRGAGGSTVSLTYQFEGRTFLSEGNGSWRPTSDHRTSSTLNTIVTGALAADTTAKNAAAAAVSDALVNGGVMKGVTEQGTTDDLIFTITDSNDLRSWLEVAKDGSAPARVRALLGAWASANLTDASVAAAKLGPDVPLPTQVTALGKAYSIVDSNDREAWGIGEDGSIYFYKLDPATAAVISAAMNAAGFGTTPTVYKSTYQTTTRQMVSGPNVVLVGHSMLAGAQPQITTALTPLPVTSLSVGGETSIGIAARQGGNPATFLPAGGQIPASGPVAVTLNYPGGINTAWPLLQGSATYTGYLVLPDGSKVPGTFSVTRDPGAVQYVHNANDVYNFTRAASGSVITCDRPAPFYYDLADAHREDIAVYWMGRNNYTATDQVIGDLQAMVQHQPSAVRRFLVLSDHNQQGTEGSGSSGYTSMIALNDRYRFLYGRRFIDTRRYLIAYGLADAGITATTQDTADIAADVVPISLRLAGDTLHLNTAGSTIVANLIKRRLLEFGWI